MVNSYQKERKEILRLVIIWMEEKGGISKLRQEHMEKALTHEGTCQFQGAEGN